MNTNTAFAAQIATATVAHGRNPIAAVQAARKAGFNESLTVVETATGTEVYTVAAEWTGTEVW